MSARAEKWVSSGAPRPSLLSVMWHITARQIILITLIASHIKNQRPRGAAARGSGWRGSQGCPCGSTPSRGDSIRPGRRGECRLRCVGQTGCAPARGITKPRFKGSSYLAPAAREGNRKHLTEGDAAKIRKLSRGHKFLVSCLQPVPQPGLSLCLCCRTERVHGVMPGPAVMGGTHTDRALL